MPELVPTIGVVGLVLVSVALAPAGVAATQEAGAPASLALDGPGSVEAGASATVRVRINTSTPVYGVEFTVRSDAEAVTFADASKGGFLARNGSSIVVANDVSDARAKYGETRLGSETGVTGSGTVATLTVSVAESASADSVTLGFSDYLVADPNATAIRTEASNLTIDLTGTATATDGPGGSDGTDGTSGSDGTDGGATDGSDGETATATQTPETGWRAKVDDAVMDRLAADGTATVLVELSGDAAADDAAAGLRSAGLTDVTVYGEVGVVGGTVAEADVEAVASLAAVRRVRSARGAGSEQLGTPPDDGADRGTAATTASGTTAPGTTAGGTSADGGPTAATARPTTDGTAPAGTDATTPASGPGFGPLAAAAALLAVAVRVHRGGRRRP